MITEKDIFKLGMSIKEHNDREYYVDIRTNHSNESVYANIFLKITSDFGYWVVSTNLYEDIDALLKDVAETIDGGAFEGFEEDFEYDDENWMPDFYIYDNYTAQNFINLNILRG